MKIRGVNLGNWLVLERWMDVRLFEGCQAEDEVWLSRDLSEEEFRRRLTEHRETYIVEKDFQYLNELGINLVRIPVPYFIFGDRKPLLGCIEYLDRAFSWAEKYHIQVLIDMHTVPGSQNGYDNGGLTGVCKWYKNAEEVEYVKVVLEKLADRYADRECLYGMEVLNEPISFPVWITSPSFGKARDKEEAKGSWYVPKRFLEQFYLDTYQRLRAILPENKTIIFHDGFRFTKWRKFFKNNNLKNVVLDTHIYIFAMEGFMPIHQMWVYNIYVKFNAWKIRRVSTYVPAVVGEWCICNKYAQKASGEEERRRFEKVLKLQVNAWNQSAGSIYWNYQLWRERDLAMDERWKESWDFCRGVERGWIPMKDFLA